tara:strand:+ start:174 stop:770 length:597 start_codon:yes stop_codon:yes gene_type:complete
MTTKIDIKAIRKVGADLIKVHGLGGEFKSDDLGTLASAHSGEMTSSQAYEYRITELNDKPENWFTPSQEGSTNDKVSWSIKRKMAMVICLTPNEVGRMVETEGTTNELDKLFRKQISDKISDKLKNIRRGMINADRRLNPDKYQRNIVKRDAQDRSLDKLADILKILNEVNEGDDSIYDIPECIIAAKNLEKQLKRKS